ncbi:hypothetical protein [Rhizobium sp. SG741]|uniref:hypothetical protein n=1 Tax=Rhizobium sp. SG741 TaxID=2587114 RepID=UPI001447C25C|nr:hypothetical protein [Rhizobium sp. SG741]NKJ09938.1 hypothetical protein [Rhizobium sp. SG741]
MVIISNCSCPTVPPKLVGRTPILATKSDRQPPDFRQPLHPAARTTSADVA